MATARPFAYNPGSLIPGTTQVGDIAVGVDNLDYNGGVGGVVAGEGGEAQRVRQAVRGRVEERE